MMKSITVPELHETFKTLKNNELILDVRMPNEYAAGHIPGAKNIPVQIVMNHAQELKQYKNIYIYCRSGGRVCAAAEILESLGVQGLSGVDDGGFPDWADAQYPVEY